MARLVDAIAAAAAGAPTDLAIVRQYCSRIGLHVLAEQQIAGNLGLFAGAGGLSGDVEAYEFTDIDRAFEIATSLKGARWGRPQDTGGF